MQLQDDTYRAIELLRFLRRATSQTPWTMSELAIVIAVEDIEITSRLAPLFQLNENIEDNDMIRSTVRDILHDRKRQGRPIPSLEAVKRTLQELNRKGWVEARRGRGFWLSNEGHQVALLDVLDAFGEDIGTAKCCKQRHPFNCPYRKVCRPYKFHYQLSSHLRSLMKGITIEDIALGRWSLERR